VTRLVEQRNNGTITDAEVRDDEGAGHGRYRDNAVVTDTPRRRIVAPTRQIGAPTDEVCASGLTRAYAADHRGEPRPSP
jgi:hypothetical protein